FVAERSLSPFGAGPIGPLTANPSDSHVSWDVSGVWQLNDHANLYARIAEGFRAPSIQGRVLFGDSISMAETETVVSFETGIKGDFLDNRLRLGLGVFAYTMQDQQLTAVGGDLNLNRLINANEVRGRGIEFDLEAYVTERLLVTAGFSYNHTEIDDPGLSVPVCFNCTVLDPIDPDTGFALLDGNSLPHAPKTIANFTARYGIPMGDSGELYFYTDWAYRSEINLFLYESIEFQGGALLEGGLRIGYAWQYGDYEVAVFGRNITDELALIGGIDFNNLTAMTNEPRLWGVEFRAKF
ncbi:MAG TPA: TonB-dependent receptor, partial [Arenimonas sp.]|nr:TonB-dependent receptor [Arenimonas sp.]